MENSSQKTLLRPWYMLLFLGLISSAHFFFLILLIGCSSGFFKCWIKFVKLLSMVQMETSCWTPANKADARNTELPQMVKSESGTTWGTKTVCFVLDSYGCPEDGATCLVKNFLSEQKLMRTSLQYGIVPLALCLSKASITLFPRNKK